MRLDLNLYNNMSGTNVNNMDIQRLVSSTQNYLNRHSKKSRRYRSSFTTEQINYLENEFKKFPYIGNVSRQELAKVLNLPERAIKIWFQNRRMKEKKDASRDTDIVEDRSNNNSMNSNNNQLNNVHNLQSTNDQFHITTPLQIANNEVKHIGIPIEMKTSISGNKPLNYGAMNDFKEQEITTTTHTFEDRSAIAKNAFCEAPRTNIRKVYENSNITELTSLRSENGDHLRNGRMNNTIQCSTMPQDLPEDLSQHYKAAAKTYTVSKDTTDSNVDARCLPVFVPNCYAPSYASGNVLWNSTNMGHIIPGRTTLPTPYHPGPFAVINQQSFRKSNCNCDCHLQFVPQVITDQTQGQFIPIFTIPYTNPQSTLVIENKKI